MAGGVTRPSVSFDRAAGTYDETRALPPDVAKKQTRALLTELRRAGADRLLEVGIGTGRIARPLAAQGVPVVGVDISRRMLGRLRDQLDGRHAPVRLALGDATALPFPNDSVSAALLVHVLHLVSSWHRALDELRRVIRPGGVLLHDSTRYADDNPWRRLFDKRAELLANLGYVPRERPAAGDIAGMLTSFGASLRTVTYAEADEREVAADVLARARSRVDSWTWEIPDAIFPRFLSQFEAHLRNELGALDVEHTTHVSYGLEVWTFP